MVQDRNYESDFDKTVKTLLKKDSVLDFEGKLPLSKPPDKTGIKQVQDTQFKKGKSGNPSGRPKQILTATELRNRLAEDMPDIINILLDLAKGGDTSAIKIILDRTHPPLKAQALPVNVPTGGTLVDQGNSIVQATLSGQIPPDIGAQLITALSNQGKLIDLEELADRLKRIERQLEARG